MTLSDILANGIKETNTKPIMTRLPSEFDGCIGSLNTRLGIALVILAVSMAAITAPVVGIAAAAPSSASADVAQQDVTADEALDAKERAQSRHDRLKELKTRDEVNVDDNLLQSVEFHLKKGNLAFQTGEYAEAKQQYERAAAQAHTGLKRAYLDGAGTLLDASESHLAALKEQGYTTSEMSTLQTRIDKQREQLQAAESPGAAETRYQDARALNKDVQSLSAPWIVRIVDLILSVWALIPLAVVLAGGTVWWYFRSQGEGTATEADLH